jgi:UDP-N-acetylmuramoyl-L-alanyl-D-glutamate--2,6-diaminopimelate ligase
VDPLQELARKGVTVERLSSDSRRCAPGVAFFAYPGEKTDGRSHIGDAIARGAAAVLWEREGFDWRQEWRVPNFAIEDLKQQAGRLAHEFYGRPSDALWVCGVTGTNGKTSCSQWIAALLEHCAVIGTLGAGFPGALSAAVNTTPDALETHFLLKSFLKKGGKAVAMEVSSHGLVQGRANSVRFACALFTNLSHDHLDYHGTMAKYAAAKAKLFDMPGLGTAVLNLDDAMGVELARRLAGRVRTIGYSLSPQKPVGVGEYIFARSNMESNAELQSSWGRAAVRLPVLGRFNVSNALGVLGCLVANGVSFEEGARLLANLPPVPGRMQAVGEEPLVVIDYAHTPDALENVLQALRPVAAARGGRLAVLFGAGGDRDPTKRPLMGAIAARLADRVLVTSDNPRGEDPLEIISQIRKGAAKALDSEADRALAIREIITASNDNDVVLIAGKGHEDYQEIAGRRTHFSDEEHARAALARRAG